MLVLLDMCLHCISLLGTYGYIMEIVADACLQTQAFTILSIRTISVFLEFHLLPCKIVYFSNLITTKL